MGSDDDSIDPVLHRGITVYEVRDGGKVEAKVLTLGRTNFSFILSVTRPGGSNKLRAFLEGGKRQQQEGDKAVQHRMDVHGSDITNVQVGYVGTRKLELCRERYDDCRTAPRQEGQPNSATGGTSTGTTVGCFGLLRNGPSRASSDGTRAAADLPTDPAPIVTIVHGGKRDTLDLLILHKDEREALVNALRMMRDTYHRDKKVQDGRANEELLLRYVWDGEVEVQGEEVADAGSGTSSGSGGGAGGGRVADYKHLARVLERLNIQHQQRGGTRGNLKTEYTEFVQTLNTTSKEEGGDKKAKAAVRPPSLGLSFSECLAFLERYKAPKSGGVWDSVFGADVDAVDVETFLTRFLHDTQHEHGKTLDDARSVLARLVGGREDDPTTSSSSIDRALFDRYLQSNANSAYGPTTLECNEDGMDRSLSQYFVCSSHNTYLTGDQLKSASSVEMYAAALERGCKCVEIDCWDGDDGEACVYHGYTLTSKIPFADIIECVRCYLEDHPDTYPIILSLENHCSLVQQKGMASLLKDKLGDRLYIPSDADMTRDLPSPQALRGKIVIKGKRPPDPDDDKDETVKTEEEKAETTEEEAFDAYDSARQSDNTTDQAKAPVSKIAPELALITLMHGCKFHSFEESMDMAPSHMHSINESKIEKILDKEQSNDVQWEKYNDRHLTRVYPAGSRVNSSNYSPVLVWTLGCQLVALNFQTADSPMILNDGLFRMNGGQGYVLKQTMLRGVETSTLRIRVVSGSCLPKPDGEDRGEVVDPYVEVKLYDVVAQLGNEMGSESMSSSSDSSDSREVTATHKTQHVLNNGFSPVFNDSWAEFQIQNEMAMLKFSVKDRDTSSLDDRIAVAAIPVSCLQSGFRSVQLYNSHSTRCGPFDFATLLIEVESVRTPPSAI